MSTIRDPAVITTAGRQMMTAGGDISYTKAVLYGQDISHLTKEQLAGLTSIGNPLLTVPVGISDKNDVGASTTVVLEATFQNVNLKADLPYTAVGFFAKRGDDTEKLVIVGVANSGACLVAASPDGVATDALDIKVAIAIGDATSVTAVVDPAGSVTPATLNGAINKLDHDLTARIDVKADKTTVESTLAAKANQSDLDQTNAEVAKKANSDDVTSQLATKANSSDVAATVKSLTDSIATKADAKTVNDAIDKIDFSPYAKTVDVQAKLDTKANTTDLAPFAKSEDVSKQIEGVSTAVTNASNTEQADIDKINKALATKRDITDSYSKDELDKKFLQLSTDTGGKVDANQVATMIENKADKSDVTKQIGTITDLVNTKANSTDVTAALDKKDDITDVDSKIKKVTDLANTKANVGDVYNISAIDTAFSQRDSKITNLQNSALQVIEGHAGDDILSFRDDKVRVYNNCQNVKNLPPMGNELWFYTVTRLSHGWGSVTVISQDNCYWQNVLNGDTWAGWTKHATSADIDNLTNQINQKANSSDVYSKSDVDGKTSGTFVTGYDVATKNSSTSTATVNSRWIVDPAALAPFADQINQLKGRQNVDAPDFNNLTDTGVYYVSDSKYKGMTNGPNNNWGVLVVSNGSNNRISQVYYPDSDVPPWMRVKSDTWHNWIQLGTNGDIQTAANLANAASNKVDTVLGNSYVRKQGMNQNGDLVEIKHTGVKQDNGGYAFDMWSDDCTASKLNDVIKNQLPSKADKSQVNTSNNLFNRMTDDSTWKTITGVDNTNNPVLTSLRDDSPTDGGNTIGGNGAGVAFGGGDTKGVLSVGWQTPHAVIAGGNGTVPVWHEEIAWKSDINNVNNQINSTNQTVSALQQTVKALNDTINSANATIKTLQDTVTKQATQITGLQTQVSNQAQDIAYIKANYIEGKRFSKSQEAQADAWEQQNSQRLAFITDN